MRQEIKEAKRQGYSDKEILDFLSQKDKGLASKISQAHEAGHESKDVVNFILKEPNRVQSLISAPVKGIIKGALDLGEFALPLVLEDEPIQEREKLQQSAIAAKGRLESGLEDVLPTQEKFIEKGLERGGKLFTSSMIGPGGIAQKAITNTLAGFSGEAVKSLGGGEGLQTVAEIVGLSLPDITKTIAAKGGQKTLIDFARSQGLSEKEIVPLIQSELKQKWLSKAAEKGKKGTERILESRAGVSRVYDQLKNSPLAQSGLDKDSGKQFLQNIHTEMKKMPSPERNAIMPDFLDLSKAGLKGNELINFYQDLNYLYSHGHRHAGKLLSHVESAMNDISPKLSSDFKLTNQLYKNSLKIGSRLKSSIYDDLLKLGEYGGLMHATISGNLSELTAFLGEKSARVLAREMLLNPKFQNLSQKMVKALNNNQFAVAKKIMDLMVKDSSQSKSSKEL